MPRDGVAATLAVGVLLAVTAAACVAVPPDHPELAAHDGCCWRQQLRRRALIKRSMRRRARIRHRELCTFGGSRWCWWQPALPFERPVGAGRRGGGRGSQRRPTRARSARVCWLTCRDARGAGLSAAASSMITAASTVMTCTDTELITALAAAAMQRTTAAD
eukprot:TRINITY_DN5407_c0_g1_i1.p1 TRINITY_DN5407_c0_g1~~TRINITY_DN5407_c0_g1_i1.p1  ORF type:complete len:162 (-),score=29.22 TRINITY_DN5407_c0_g1_i1:542-1027(-)